MNRRTLAILSKCKIDPMTLIHLYQSESHPAERKQQVVNLATELIKNPSLPLESLPQNDRACAKTLIKSGILLKKNHEKLKLEHRTWRSNKRRNLELAKIVKSNGVSDSSVNQIVEKTSQATSKLVDEFAPELKKHFAYSQKEDCLRLKHTPSLKEAESAVRGSLSLMHGSTLAQSEAKWIAGNVIDEIVNTYGDKLKMKEIAHAMGVKTNTMSICLNVYRNFKGTRIRGLSFSHHREVMYCHAISPQLKMDMLINARKYNMSVMELRRLCAYMRSKLELEMKMPEKVLKKDLQAVLSQNMSDHVTCYMLVNVDTGYSRYLRGKLTSDMISKFNFIMQIKPTMAIIKGKIDK